VTGGEAADARRAQALWEQAGALRVRGEAGGAVAPLAHRVDTFDADGIAWNLRVLTGAAPRPATAPDPFLPPYDERLHVADLGRNHALLLNKFPVLPGHLLVVTTRDAPQTAFPDPGDFAATAPLLAGPPALAFYNGGHESGASQPHRHLQAVSLPLGPAPDPVPTAPWIEAAADGSPLPFPGAATRLPTGLWNRGDVGAALHATGAALLRRCGRDPADPGAFNLLFTRAWMLAVPRTVRKYRNVAVNSLGYAGAMIVKSEEGLRTLHSAGPLDILRAAAG